MKSFLLVLFLAAAAAVALFIFQVSSTIGKIQNRAASVRDHLYFAANRFLPENFSQAKTELESAKRDIDQIVDLFESMQVMRFLPILSSRYETGHSFSRIAQQFVDSGIELAGVVEYISEPIRSNDGTIVITGISETDKRIILERTVKSISTLHGIRATLELTRGRLAAMPDPAIEQAFIPIKRDLLAKSESIIYTIDQALPLLEIIPPLFGYREEKKYLLLLQDPSELRPTGGVVEMYALLAVRDATILSLSSEKTRGDMREQARGRPAAITNFTREQLPSGFLQDSNWSSDFVFAAQEAAATYRAADQTDIDGVIAVTPEFFLSLLRMTRDLRIGDTIWSSSNFVSELESQLQYTSPPLGKLTRAIIDAVNAMPFQRMYDVTKVMEARLNEKHILVWFRESKLQTFARANHWIGEIRESDTDFLMITDANVASKKTDPFVERSVTSVLVQDELDHLTVSLEILYRNNATIGPQTDRYRNRIQIIVPKGSELLSADGFREHDQSRDEAKVSVREESGYTLFEGFTVVEPFQNQKIRLQYRLPNRLEKKILREGRYSLFVQRQPGSATHLTATYFFRKPITAFTKGGFFTTPAGSSEGVTFRSDLRVDRDFFIQF